MFLSGEAFANGPSRPRRVRLRSVRSGDDDRSSFDEGASTVDFVRSIRRGPPWLLRRCPASVVNFYGVRLRRVRSIRRALALTVPRARSYVTVVISIRSWRRDRRSESTFDARDDEPAVTEEFLSNKPKTDRRKVDVRLRRGEATINYSDERQLYDGRSSAYFEKTPRLRPAHRLPDRKLTRNAGPDANIG